MTTDEVSFAPWQVRPLTRTRRSDGSPYRREPDVEAQVREISALPERERVRRLLEDGLGWDDTRRVREETLVYFIREYLRRELADTAWKLAEILPGRVANHVKNELAKWRLSREDAEDCAHDLQALMWRAIFDTETKSEFWEVHFWTCLDRKLWNLTEKRQAVSDSELNPGGQSAERTEDGADLLLLSQADPLARPEETAEIRAALATLNANEQRAVYLVHVLGLPEESDDPEKQSAARTMNVTGRSIRNYLRRAREKIDAWQRADETRWQGQKK